MRLTVYYIISSTYRKICMYVHRHRTASRIHFVFQCTLLTYQSCTSSKNCIVLEENRKSNNVVNLYSVFSKQRRNEHKREINLNRTQSLSRSLDFSLWSHSVFNHHEIVISASIYLPKYTFICIRTVFTISCKLLSSRYRL